MGAGKQRRVAAGLGAALALAVMAVVAVARLSAQVLAPGTQPADGSGDPAFPAFMDGAVPGTLLEPSVCATCHGGYRQPGEAIHEPFDLWAGSMMANSLRDPLFLAALDIANQDDAAFLGDVGIGDWCLRCHAPKAWYEGRSRCTNAWGEPSDASCLTGSPSLPDGDFEGVTCHFCHRMYDASVPPPGQVADPLAPRVGNGQVYLTNDPLEMIGPFTDPQPSPFHAARGEAFLRSSEFCGQCHDVTNPVREFRVAGVPQGRGVPVDRTYAEWRQSIYADPTSPEYRTCQDCHMPPPDLDGDGTPDAAFAASVAAQPRGGASTLQGPLHRHAFAGASSWMLEVIKAEHGASLGREASYDAGIAATLEALTTRTVSLEMETPATAIAGAQLRALVRVFNLTGHKFPTGYPEGRRAWINLRAGPDLDGDGTLDDAELTFESGIYNPATGLFSLVDPRGKPRFYEARFGIWDWIAFDPIQGCDVIDEAGQKLFHNMLVDCIAEDTRIPPLGFRPTPDTEPVKYTFFDNPAIPGTLGNWDDTTYTIAVPPSATTPYVVRATIYYQSTSLDYVEFLRNRNRSTCDPSDPGCDPTQPDPRPNRGEKMYDTWVRYNRAPPVALASLERVVPVAPPPVGEASRATASQQLRVSVEDAVAGTLALAYAPACRAVDHAVVAGSLADLRAGTWSREECGLGVTGAASFDPGPGTWCFVVVGRGVVSDGSYGRDSLGRQRPGSLLPGACDLPQDLTATCN